MTNLLTSNELREKLKTRNLTKVAEAVGIPYQSLYRYANIEGSQLKHDVALKLIKFIEEN